LFDLRKDFEIVIWLKTGVPERDFKNFSITKFPNYSMLGVAALVLEPEPACGRLARGH
jgi:hypothetical protein